MMDWEWMKEHLLGSSPPFCMLAAHNAICSVNR
jgi:hypothetical protein